MLFKFHGDAIQGKIVRLFYSNITRESRINEVMTRS
jgi:hypothetical protein